MATKKRRNRRSTEFVDAWKTFLVKTKSLCERKLDRRENAYQALKPLLADVIAQLETDRAINEMRRALNDAQGRDNELMREFFLSELKFFNDLVGEGGDTSGDDEAISAAKTIKESIEDWLGDKRKARWWKQLLKVLNELLSLIRGG